MQIVIDIKVVNKINCGIDCPFFSNSITSNADSWFCRLFSRSIEWKKTPTCQTSGPVRCDKCMNATEAYNLIN